jgi:gamma-glutamyltranspeptidase / glutathione hydrolase
MFLTFGRESGWARPVKLAGVYSLSSSAEGGLVVTKTHRGVVVAKNGVVAASQPLAVSAGLAVLQQGGTCIDAAIATSAVLTVTEPYASHLGGDAFVIYYDASTRTTTACNASGAAPRSATPERFPGGIPVRALSAVSVPGLVDCWFRLHERYGSRPMAELLGQATDYAEHGFPAGYRYCGVFQEMARSEDASWFSPMARTLTGLDSLPSPGQAIRQPELAWTFRQIAEGGRESFYEGPVAERILAHSDRQGGLFSPDDLAAHSTQVSDPIRTDYRGYTIHGQPPVSQGHILLQMLNLVEGFDVASMGHNSADLIHVMAEAKKLAFADRHAYLGDPQFVQVPMDDLLSKEYAGRRRPQIDLDRAAQNVRPGEVTRDTTYFCVADRHGNAVSFIQSVFHVFGSGMIAEGTGVLFNNRMTGFSLDPASPNVLAPGKRPAHTLNAYIVTQSDELAWVGGTPGADIQVQSNLQVISNVIDFGMNPQAAAEAPRWQHVPGGTPGGALEVEDRVDEGTLKELARRGHEVRPIGPWAHGSRYQLIALDRETGAYHAGSDPRSDGHAAGC